jgi:hypothetical protein
MVSCATILDVRGDQILCMEKYDKIVKHWLREICEYDRSYTTILQKDELKESFSYFESCVCPKYEDSASGNTKFYYCLLCIFSRTRFRESTTLSKASLLQFQQSADPKFPDFRMVPTPEGSFRTTTARGSVSSFFSTQHSSNTNRILHWHFLHTYTTVILLPSAGHQAVFQTKIIKPWRGNYFADIKSDGLSDKKPFKDKVITDFSWVWKTCTYDCPHYGNNCSVSS